MTRPPIKAAQDEATKVLIQHHQDEWDDLVTSVLRQRGWEQATVEKTVWKQQSAKD